MAEAQLELRRGDGAVPKLWHAQIAVVLYTLVRVVANLTSALLTGSARDLPNNVIISMICDGLVRPMATGFGIFGSVFSFGAIV